MCVMGIKFEKVCYFWEVEQIKYLQRVYKTHLYNAMQFLKIKSLISRFFITLCYQTFCPFKV